MAGSTYSTNLKLELMTTGENSGTWGDVTNTNLGTALEQAVVGYGNPDYVSDANLTISITNTNAAQPARALVLNVTSTFGSLTATRELVVPTIQKQYIVQNNTSGGQSITVKTSAGTGITVPNGRKAHLYVDGTNVIQMFDFVDINGGAIDGTTIGASSASTGAFTTLNASGATTLDGNVTLGNASGDTVTVTGTIASNLLFTDNTYDIGASGATRPRNLYLAGAATIGGNLSVGGTLTLTGGLTLNGNVTVGDSAADTLTINSTVTSNLIFTDNTYDIGASGATRPRNLFLAGNATVGGAQTLTGALTVDSTTDTSSATTGSIQTDGGVGIAKGLYVGGNTTLGDASADTVTVNGTVTSNLIFTDNTYDIGASGATRPRNAFLAGNLGVGGVYTAGKGFIQSSLSSSRTFEVGGSSRSNVELRIGESEGGWEMGYASTNNAGTILGGFYAAGVAQALNNMSIRIGTTDVVSVASTLTQIQPNVLIGTSTSGGMSAQTGLTVIGGATASDNAPGIITIGSHYNSRAIGDNVGQLNFYSNDASGSASGVQAAVRALTSTSLGDASNLAFYGSLSSSSLILAGTTSGAQWQFGGNANSFDGNFKLTLFGSAGENNGISIYETSTGNNARLRIYQAAANVYYDATYSGGGNVHNFQIGSGNVASISATALVVGSSAALPYWGGNALQGPSFSINQVAGVDQTAYVTGAYQATYTGPWLARGAYRAAMYQQASGNHYFFSNGTTPASAGSTVSFTQALLIDSGSYTMIGSSTPNYQLEVYTTDSTGNRTTPYNVAGITAYNVNAPFSGYGAGLVFKSSTYGGASPIVGARIRNQINDDSVVSYGSSLAFDVTATRSGSLAQAMEVSYDGFVYSYKADCVVVGANNESSGTATFYTRLSSGTSYTLATATNLNQDTTITATLEYGNLYSYSDAGIWAYGLRQAFVRGTSGGSTGLGNNSINAQTSGSGAAAPTFAWTGTTTVTLTVTNPSSNEGWARVTVSWRNVTMALNPVV